MGGDSLAVVRNIGPLTEHTNGERQGKRVMPELILCSKQTLSLALATFDHTHAAFYSHAQTLPRLNSMWALPEPLGNMWNTVSRVLLQDIERERAH